MNYSIHELKPKKNNYSLVVVSLNEGERLKNQLKKLFLFSFDVDIIVADGNSTDGSTEEEFLKKNGVRTLLTMNELGLGRATRHAFEYCMDQGYLGIITIDGNGKDGLDKIPVFIKGLIDGYDLIQGGRFLKNGYHKNTPLERLLAIRLIVSPILALSTGYWFSDPTNAFRAISRNFILDHRVSLFRPIFIRFNFQIYLIYKAAKLKVKILQIPVSRTYPGTGAIPTKIVGYRIKLIFLKELCKTALGHYDP